jgi:hypothetical protein
MYGIVGHPNGCLCSSGMRCPSKGCLRPTYRDSMVVSSSRVAIDISTLEDETHIMSRNVRHRSHSNPALHRRRTKTSAMVQKPENYTMQFTFVCHNHMVGAQTFEARATLVKSYVAEVPLSQTLITYKSRRKKVCAFFQGSTFVAWKIIWWCL